MKLNIILATGALLVLPGLTLAQELHEIINFEALKAKAEDTVEVNLEGGMLKMALGFLGESKDEQMAKNLIGNLKGIYVRSLKFNKPGMYSTSDAEKIRAQVKGPQWSKMVDVRSNQKDGENVGVYMRSDGDKMTGLLVLSFEPEELTVVNIVGAIDPSALRTLGGKLGIPNINMGFDAGKKPTAPGGSAKKKSGRDDEDDDE